jgi:hypothetical protein
MPPPPSHTKRTRLRKEHTRASWQPTHGMSRALTSDELDELLISLTNAGSRTLSSSAPIDDSSSAPSSSSSSSPVLPPLLITASKKRPTRQPTVAEQAEELMDCDETGLPVAVDEDTRKARKMARNRRAAAVSRERKKQRVDELEEQVAALQQENASLKRRLACGSSGSETSETISDVESWPLSQQPEAFWLTYAPLKQACTPPPFHALLPRLLASLWTLCFLTLRMTTTTSSACSAATTDAPARASSSTSPSSELRPHHTALSRCVLCGRARHSWLRGMLHASTFVCVSSA